MEMSRMGALMGCLSSIIFTLSWVISAMLWGNWTLGSNSLSDIGVCGVVSAEMVFNAGCMITGVLVLFLALALIIDDNIWFRMSGIAAMISGFACFAIGIINENYGDIHMTVAGIYGGFAAATIALSGAGDFIEERRPFTLLAAVLLLICALSSRIHPFGVFEPIAVSCILIWTFIQSAILYDKNTKEGVSGNGH